MVYKADTSDAYIQDIKVAVRGATTPYKSVCYIMEALNTQRNRRHRDLRDAIIRLTS
jgi:hypothetical protein